MTKRKKPRLVKDATQWENMAGDTPLEQMLNAYLTTWFVMQYDVPHDECLNVAQLVIKMVRSDEPFAVFQKEVSGFNTIKEKVTK